MCTVVIRTDPGADWPVTMLAMRDESPSRPWDPPGAWWPDRDPTVRGVRDRSAGGAWLAASDAAGLAVVLNRWEPVDPTAAGGWTTRGVLPLDAVIDGVEPNPAGEQPTTRAFNLMRVAPDGAVTVTAWDGERVRRTALGPGVHMLTHGAPDDPAVARIAAWLPAFREAPPTTPPVSGPLEEIARIDDEPDPWTPWFRTLVASTADGPHAATSLLRDNDGPEGRFATLSIVAAAVRPGRVVLQHARLAEPGRIDADVILGHA
ncbi:NRDE family protein [Curtobacterium ammoniigenes]|uniref:NRDE family protein n=1 Tax=Curtobacterium ammoniigenes TaxID=395387 RepID=UPI000832E801|nr:NRDE family protein [Curtobacterium ammoniigenes]